MLLPLPVLSVLLTGGLLFSPLPLSRAEEYYVSPTQPPNPACPSGKPCYTLNDYAKNASSLFSGKGDVSLLFLDGVHNLTSPDLEISNTTNVTMAGSRVNNSDVYKENPYIHIASELEICFSDISIISIYGKHKHWD